MFDSLTIEEKQTRHNKVTKFFDFIHYDWGDETKGPTVNMKTGTKQWQIYKEVHQYSEKSDEERQHQKRKFFNDVIDKEFEKTVETNSPADMKQF